MSPWRMRVLVIDDEAKLSRHVLAALTEAGHDPEAVHDGETALERLSSDTFDLIVLDVGLPGVDGFEILKRLRKQRNTCRVLMLTSRGELSDRLTGLQLGADDYLPKPFAMQELIARVHALSRRYADEPALVLRAGDVSLHVADQAAYRAGEKLDLSTRELTLLRVLMREPGRVFTRTELCERVWEREHEYDTKLVEVFIGRLRKKLGSPSIIETIRHVGYTIPELKSEPVARKH